MRTQAKRSNRILSTVVFALVFPLVSDAAQPPPVLWERTFAPAGASAGGYGVQQTSDGGYLLVGQSQNMAYLVKTDARGIMQWQRTQGEGQREGSKACSIEPTSDGGFIVVGWTNTNNPSYTCAYLIKLDAAGNEQWEKIIGQEHYSKYGSCARQTADGGYIITGLWGNHSVPLLKTDFAGNVQWEKIFDSGWGGEALVQATDGGYLVVGATTSPTQAFLIRTDASGNLTWRKTYGRGYAYSVELTPDGGYAIAGRKGVPTADLWLFKVDSSGNLLWDRTYGNGSIYSVRRTTDGGFILTGRNYLSPYRLRLIKTDANGSTEWEKTFAGAGTAGGESVLATADGSYVVLGWTYTGGSGSAYLIKVGQPPAAARPAWRLYR